MKIVYQEDRRCNLSNIDKAKIPELTKLTSSELKTKVRISSKQSIEEVRLEKRRMAINRKVALGMTLPHSMADSAL